MHALAAVPNSGDVEIAHQVSADGEVKGGANGETNAGLAQSALMIWQEMSMEEFNHLLFSDMVSGCFEIIFLHLAIQELILFVMSQEKHPTFK